MNQAKHISVLICFAFLMHGCNLIKIPQLAKRGKVMKEGYTARSSFNYEKDIILFEVVIDGKPYNFVFDTGAELSVIGKHISDAIKYKSITSAKIKATNKSEDKLEFIEVSSIAIAGVEFERTGAIITDLSFVDESFGCSPIDGIIGNNLLRKAIWQIDYKNELLTFSDVVDSLDVSENASVITMDAGKIRNVHFDVTIDSVSSKFAFDTGCSCTMKADSNFFNRLKTQNQTLQYSTETGIAHSDLNGNVIGQIKNVLAKTIDIEGVVISDQVISMGENYNYLVGNEIFKNYILTIDWKNDKLFLDQTTEFVPDTITGFEFSFAPNYKTRKFKVVKFNDDHPLTDSISMDSEIISINNVNVSLFTLSELCDYWEKESNNILNSKTIDVTVLDKGVEKPLRLTSKVLLPKF